MREPGVPERGRQARDLMAWVVLPALLATVVLVLLLALVLRPAIESSAEDAAREAVQGPLERAETQIASLAKKVGAKPPSGLTEEEDPAPTVTPVDGRLEVGASSTFSVPDGQTLKLTDLVLENPDGASGRMIVGRGDATLLEVRLETFRSVDYHFVTPIVLNAGDELTVRATCTGEGSCSPALLYVGSIEKG